MDDRDAMNQSYRESLLRFRDNDAKDVVENDSIENLLSMVVVTSALPLHPRVDMLVYVLSSYLLLEPSLVPVQKFLICDKCKTGSKQKFKSGIVDTDTASNYEAYCDELERRCKDSVFPFVNCRIIRMPVYSGFGFCLQTGLKEMKTKFALVIQHDRALKVPCDVADIMETLVRNPTMRYLGLVSSKSSGIAKRHKQLKLSKTHSSNGRILEPTPFWYDSTHFANVKFYLEFIFGWHYIPAAFPEPFRMKTGDFPEDKVGQALLSAIKAAKSPAEEHALYGMFLLDDGITAYVLHMNARKMRLDKMMAIFSGKEDEPSESPLKCDDDSDDNTNEDGEFWE